MREDDDVRAIPLECGCGTSIENVDANEKVRCPTCDVSWHLVDGRWKLWEAVSPPIDWLNRGAWGNEPR